MTTKTAEAAFTIDEAAALKRVSPSTIRKAIKATADTAEVKMLRAKNIGSAAQPRYRIAASALEDWFERLADA